MKALYRLLALIVFFSCSTVVLADDSGPSFEGLTQDDGPEVFRIIEASGYFEVIPDEELREVRGAGFSQKLLMVWNKSAPVRKLYFAYQSADILGWEIGRYMAIKEGYPDPGRKPGFGMVKMAVYFAADRL